MPAYNAAFARTRILEFFADIPPLNFERLAVSNLDFQEPDLDRPKDLYQEVPEVEPARPDRHSALQEVVTTLSSGTLKLRYGESWKSHFRFEGDRLRRVSKGEYVIVPAGYRAKTKFVNHTATRAQNWFQNELLKELEAKKRAHVYLLGDPGAGKSTLIKYLINENAVDLHNTGKIFARFEFLKFYYRWNPTVDTLREKLADYMSFILLRDLLRTVAYSIGADGSRSRIVGIGPFRDWETIQATLVDIRYAGRPPEEFGHRFTGAVDALEEALCPDGIDHDELLKVPYWARICLIDHFRHRWAVTVVMDGLDCVAVEDAQFDAQRHQVLNGVLSMRSNLTTLPRYAPNDPLSNGAAEVEASVLFIMRANTFYLHRDGMDDDVKNLKGSVHYVGGIDPSVAMHNAIARAAAKLPSIDPTDQRAAGRLANQLTRATFAALLFISRAIRASDDPAVVLGLFAGNLRSLFRFMRVLLQWFVDDALRSRSLDIPLDAAVEDILKFIVSARGMSVLRQKSYRIVEILLYSSTPWFENAIEYRKPTALERRLMGAHGDDLVFKDNVYFTGLVDNIFNYHVRSHANRGELHAFLEKLRILQCLGKKSLTEAELEDALFEHFGYRSIDLSEALIIMMRVQLIKVSKTSDGLLLTATSKGEVVFSHLSRTLAYLEHVFHRTLFPEVLIRSVADERRDAGQGSIDRWTACSIRNAFILLAYLNSVEDHAANRKVVSATRRIFGPTRDGVVHSIDRILKPRERKRAHQNVLSVSIADDKVFAEEDGVASEALKLIQATVKHWQGEGCLDRRWKPRALDQGDVKLVKKPRKVGRVAKRKARAGA